ncbi:MAG: Gldg family protein [Clostridia bacterium]|nr:Gldg family protein [Clostridia bacterium]
MRRKNFYNAKKKKFAVYQTALTALFIALMVVFNAGIYAIADHFRWYIDMTEGQVFSLYPETKELLKAVEEDSDKEVNIYFTVEPDKVYEASPYLFYVYQTALEMEKEFDYINVENIDVVKNPGFYKTYYTTAAQDIYTTSVLVTSGEEFRLFNLESFFVNNDDGKIWAYQGEYRIVSAILSMTAADMPSVVFTTSHGETIGNEARAFVSLFEDAGFEVHNVDLSKEDIPEDTRIMVINDPVYDFGGIEAEGTNEIEKIDAFLDSYGCLMVFSSPEKAAKLTNLSEFLSEWGISFTPDTYVKDSGNALSVDQKTVLCAYDEDSLGASLYLDIANLDTPPRTVVRNAMPLNILWDEDDDLEGTKEISPVLLSHDSAVKVVDGKEEKLGSAPLMTVTRETRIEDNEYYYSYVLACGSSDYTKGDWLNSNSYANSDIIYNAMRITGRERVLADIEYKVLDDTSLDITTAQANGWTVALTVTAPLLLAICGVVVWVRRKNS